MLTARAGPKEGHGGSLVLVDRASESEAGRDTMIRCG